MKSKAQVDSDTTVKITDRVHRFDEEILSLMARNKTGSTIPSGAMLVNGLLQNAINVPERNSELTTEFKSPSNLSSPNLPCPDSLIVTTLEKMEFETADYLSSNVSVTKQTTYSSEGAVDLEPGFDSGYNEYFEAKIEGCSMVSLE
ncbi:3-coathanger stack domain-containing protein [Jiulongibacter sp. NS-SX5]|uniref:3-coathanger stack domain-containing protein n=1 Tax=Jiulongibacter sp. NS-SX5 TaxID=3463854 RepID=UPI004059E09C